MPRVTPLLLAALIGGVPTIAWGAVRRIPVGAFTQLTTDGRVTVIVTPGPRTAVLAEGSAAALRRVRIAADHGLLMIAEAPAGWRDWRPWATEPGVTVRVTVPVLRSARLEGSGDLAIDRVTGRAFGLSLGGSGTARLGQVAVGRLALALDGSGDIVAAGRTDDLIVAVHGSGNVHAARLQTTTATVTLAGSGDITIDARGGVTGALAGTGGIAVTGPAGCNVARSGTGAVHCAGDRRGQTH